MDIEVQALELTGKQLQALSEDERVFLVQGAHLANTITVLLKWLIFTRIQSSPKSVEGAAEATQHALVMKILCGVLYEGWQVLHKSYFSTQLSKKYDPGLSDDAREDLRSLKTYFKGDSLIARIRNRFAFHFDREAVEDELGHLDPDARYHFYLSCTGNSLYYLSEELVGFAMLRAVQDLTDATETPEVFDRLFEDLKSISNTFARFINRCLLLVVREFMPTLSQNDFAQIDVSDVPPLGQVRIPFFVAMPEDGILL